MPPEATSLDACAAWAQASGEADMSRIFINYRRETASGYAGRLYDRLVMQFGRDNVYMDVDMRIPLGRNFTTYLRDAVESCAVMLVVIDRAWITARDRDGQRRLDNPADFVRMEIEMALRRDIPVIPIFTQNAPMPRADELPSELQELAYRQGLELSDSRFDADFGRLQTELETVLQAEAAALSPPAEPERTAVEAPATPPETPRAVELPERFTNDLGMTFVRIPAGAFTMGSPDSDRHAYDEEKPAHQVTISQPFYLGVHPVTQAQWEAVMGSNPSHFKGKPTHPVEQVSWNDAQQFLQRLNARRDGYHYALPSEAQWEYACCAGSTGAYCFGDDEGQLGTYAWYDDNADGATHPVGEKQSNVWGLYDMHGNVWEWVADGQRTYTVNAVTDPTGPTDAGAERVFRGGGWYDSAQGARSADRYGLLPGYRVESLGFRCLSAASSQ